MPARSSPTPSSLDHDLLIRIETLLGSLTSSVAQNHNDVTMRLNTLDREKAGYKDLDVLRATIITRQDDADKLAEKVRSDAKELAKKVQTDAEELAIKVDWTRRMLWLGIGGLIVLNVAMPIIVGLAMRK